MCILSHILPDAKPFKKIFTSFNTNSWNLISIKIKTNWISLIKGFKNWYLFGDDI